MSETDGDAVARLRARSGPPATAAAADQAQPPTAPAPGARPAPGTAGPVGPVQVVSVAAAVVAVLVAALAAVVGMRVSHRNAVSQARDDALAAASRDVAIVLSYDYRTLDRDFARAEAVLTPAFRKQYDATTAKGVKPLAAQYHATSSAVVAAAGSVEAGADRAVVLVFVDQTVTNSRLAAPRLDRSRIKVSLVKSHGRWLISRLDPV